MGSADLNMDTISDTIHIKTITISGQALASVSLVTHPAALTML